MSDANYVAYLMAHFGPLEQLYFAYSTDALNWRPIRANRPIFDINARVRDPYMCRVRNQFHLVHTLAWDNPAIAHWVSDDLCQWRGQVLNVVPPSKLRAWAPEFTYVEEEDLIYLYWSSEVNNLNILHYTTTRDFTDISPERSDIFFDIGKHAIDLTITRYENTWVGFYKPGTVDDMSNNLMLTTTHLDPRVDGFGNKGEGADVLPGPTKPIEGPEVIKLIGENRWYIYCDPFHAPMQAWETRDFATFEKIDVQLPKAAKHCSMIAVTEAELQKVLTTFGT